MHNDIMFASAMDIIQRLIDTNQTVATAESCTGGMLASLLIDIPGCSVAIHESYVTYSDEAKHRILGVSNKTLDEYSAVSEQCAREMADGVRRISSADFGVATTGYAGPGGGTESDPVGTVYIAVSSKSETIVYCIHCGGDRANIRKMACVKALLLLRNALFE